MSTTVWFYRENSDWVVRSVTAAELAALRSLDLIRWDTPVMAEGITQGWTTLEVVWATHIFPYQHDLDTLQRIAAERGVTRPTETTPDPAPPSSPTPTPPTSTTSGGPIPTPPSPPTSAPIPHPGPPSPSPGNSALPRLAAAAATLVLLALAALYLVRTVQTRNSGNPDTVDRQFRTELSRLLSGSTVPSWQVLRDLEDLQRRYPDHRTELLAPLTNYLTFAAPGLPPSGTDVESCAEVLAAAADSGHIPALRFLAHASNSPTLGSRAKSRLEQLQAFAVDEMGRWRHDPRLLKPAATLPLLADLLAAIPESTEAIASRADPLLEALRGEPLSQPLFERHRAMLETLATAGSRAAAKLLGSILLQNPSRSAEARRWLRHAVTPDDPEVHRLLGYLAELETPVRGLPAAQEAAQYYEQAVSARDPVATYLLAHLHLDKSPADGASPSLEQTRALTLLEGLCTLPRQHLTPRQQEAQLHALEWLGDILLRGAYQQRQRPADGLRYLRQAAALGSTNILDVLGIHLAGLPYPGRLDASETHLEEGLRYLEQGTSQGTAESRARCRTALGLLPQNRNPSGSLPQNRNQSGFQ